MNEPIQTKNYISLDLDYSPYKIILGKLDDFLGTKLKNRGEAHITVITPPEFKIITQTIAADLLHSEWLSWENKKFNINCLGSRSIISNDTKKTLSTYYLVVEANDLKDFRKYIANKYNITQFNPGQFYPHITLGFTDRDLHYEDGIIKDKQSCKPELEKLRK